MQGALYVGLSSVRPLLRLSVRLSVTRVDQSKTVKVRIMQLSPHAEFLRYKFIPEILTGTPERAAGASYKGGVGKQTVFFSNRHVHYSLTSDHIIPMTEQSECAGKAYKPSLVSCAMFQFSLSVSFSDLKRDTYI